MQTKSLQLKRALNAALLILCLCLAGMTKMYAYDFSAVCETGQTLYYNITNATNHYLALTCPGTVNYNGWSGFTKPIGEIILPESVQYNDDTYTITTIGSYAFYGCSGLIGSLTIPSSVTTIGSYAFYSCSGFSGSLTIPNSVTSIGNWAFASCSGFTEVIYNATNCADVDDYLDTPFGDCGGTLTIGANVERIPARMFNYSGFTGSLTIPNSVTSIGNSAFSGCSGFSGSLTIPNSVTSIGGWAFASCSGFTEVIYNATNCADLVDEGPFVDCGGTLTIGTNVERIPALMFEDSDFTGSLTIPNSVTSIGSYAFYYCYSLTSIEIPNSVTSIGSGAFYYCYSLTSITIPNSVISLGTNPFGDCSGLVQINVDSENTVYDSRENCNAIIKTNTNELVTGCKNTVIPNSVTSIGSGAFSGCFGLTSITIPNSVTSIGSFAFYYCTGLTSITILAETPPTLVGGYVFDYVNKSIPVYVPCASQLAYQNTTGWNEFTNYMPATACAPGVISVTANPAEGGTVTGAGYYDGGEVCTLTATATPGYSFINWTKNGNFVSNNPVISFTVTENADYVANFNSLINPDVNNIVYVKPDGCGLNDGSSWENATSNLNLALEYSSMQANKPTVWVAAGTYYGDGVAYHNAFTMVDGVNVYGGFAGNEPADYDLDLRDFEANETVLDGQNEQRVLYQPADFENNTTWSGFSIKNGYLYVENTSIMSYGAGAFIRNNTILENSIITANSLYVMDNVAQGKGAGVYLKGVNSQLKNCVVTDNNLVKIDGGGPLIHGSYGGGVYAELASVNKCVIANNHTNSWAGGILVTAANVNNSLIVNNNAEYSGGIHAFGDATTIASIINCDIINNNAIEKGGGVGTAPSTPIEFINCIIWGNNTDTYSYLNLDVGTATSFNYCAIEDGYSGFANIDLASDNDGTEALNYVRFIDVENNDFQLQYNSACVDAGDPNYSTSDTLDLAGNPRIYNGRIDIGCYEFNSTPIETNISAEICQGEDYLQNGFEIYYPEVGENQYSITLSSSQNIDSIVNLTLTVYPIYFFSEDTTLCNASSYSWRGYTLTESGTYYDSLQTIHGCDSIYALSLEFFNTPLGEFTYMTPTNNYPFTTLPITFSWDAVSGAEYYNLYLWNVNEPAPSTPYASNIYNRSCYVPSLQNHQTYNWYVEAVNTCFSTTSSVRSFSLNIQPTINVSASNLNFGEVALNNSNTLNLYVSGNALDDAITMQISGEDASMFSFEQGANWNGLTGGSLSVTFSPTAVQYNYTANLVITTGTLTQTVQLTGSLADMFVFNTFVTQDVFEMNSTVPIYGTVMDASNNPAASAEVEVKVTVMNMTRSLFATTGADGHFSVDFVPAYSESGYYTINSGRVGHNSTAVHDYFNILGMNLVTNDWILWDVVQNETSTGSIVIRNRSQIPLNNIQVTANTLPDGCSFTFQPLSLAGMEEGVLEYNVSGTTPTNGYQEVALVATSSEGASMNFTVWYRCAEPRGILYASPNNITTTMTKGINKIVDVMLYNNGTGPTGKVYLDLPSVDWLSVVGNDTLPSIAVQDSAYFSLRLSANENTPLVQYTGNIAINCERGDGLSLPYTIMAVSDSTGTLIVDVTDDYTYNGNGQHLQGATVTVKGYYSLETVAMGLTLTDSNGLFTVNDIPEGYYRMSITAPNHADYQATIQIEGGQTNTQDIYLQYQAITYSWIVVPTEIQDEYTFELIVEYETNVPVPVVVIDMPQTFPELAEGESFVFDYIITNYGLVDTYDATLYPPTNHPLYDFTPLITEIDTLHAQTSVVIPCTMTMRTGQRSQAVIEALGESIDRDGDCPDRALTEVHGYYYCNGEKKPCTYYCWRNIGSHPCNTPPSSSGGGGGGGSSPGGSGSGGGGVHFGGSGGSSTPPVTTQQQGCNDDPTLPNALDELNSCPPQFDTTPKLPPVQPGNRGNN